MKVGWCVDKRLRKNTSMSIIQLSYDRALKHVYCSIAMGLVLRLIIRQCHFI